MAYSNAVLCLCNAPLSLAALHGPLRAPPFHLHKMQIMQRALCTLYILRRWGPKRDALFVRFHSFATKKERRKNIVWFLKCSERQLAGPVTLLAAFYQARIDTPVCVHIICTSCNRYSSGMQMTRCWRETRLRDTRQHIFF
jgi:hypothetical protein